MELEGETVLRSKPVIGYLHTGMEKTGEELTYVQGATNVTRWTTSRLCTTSSCTSLATEELLGIDIPPWATWIRMLMCELNRISSHVMWTATNGMDFASTSMMIYGFREREMILHVLREDHRAADQPRLHPARRRRGRPARWLGGRRLGDHPTRSPGRIDEYDELLTGQPIFRERCEGVGII